MAELQKQPQFTLRERSIYVWAMYLQPRSVRDLAVTMGLSWRSVAAACRRLAETEWMMMQSTPGGIRPIPRIPLRCQLVLAKQLEEAYEQSPNKGELLMKRHLLLRINCDRFTENARPGHLASPTTDVPYEYDMFYPTLGVAFEFHGQQHFEAAPGLMDDKAHKELRARDLVKESLSAKAGVKLVVIKAEDLKHGNFDKLLPDGLPRLHVDEDGPYYQTLSRISGFYAEKTERMARQQRQELPQR
jgi:hypothetical protein